MNEALLNNPLLQLGRTLRSFREKTRKGQADVAKGAGISVSMLSQIELGKVSPSIDTLLRVCAALGLEPVELFRHVAPQRPVRVHRRGERLRTGSPGVVYEQLVDSPDLRYPAEMFLLEVEPGHQVGLGGRGHEGIEMGYVLEGTAEIEVGEERYAIGEGDTVSFSAHLAHRLVNSPRGNLRAVWTVMPPHKDYLDVSEPAAGTADGSREA